MRHVLALAEQGSFARAAATLRLSQPALSRSIQTLEQQVGAELFLRSAAGAVPTDIGRVLVQRAREVVQMAEDLERELLSTRTLQSGQLCVGGGPFPVDSVLTPALARFIDAYPRVSVRLQMRDWDELLQRLRARELDFFVAEFSTFKNEPDLELEPLTEHALHFVARHGHPLAARSQVTAADTYAYPFVSPARISPRVLVPMLAARRKAIGHEAAARVFPSLECSVMASVKRVVQGSDAITALLLPNIADELQERRLTVLGAEPWLSIRYGVVSLKGRPISSAAARLREFVVDAEAAFSRDEAALLAQRAAADAVTAGGEVAGPRRSTARKADSA